MKKGSAEASMPAGRVARRGRPPAFIEYRRSTGVDDFVRRVAEATPLQMVETERQGVAGSYLKDLAERMGVPAVRMYAMLGVPKATAEKKAAAAEKLGGSGGQAALGLARLLAIAREIVAESTAADVRGFDEAKWLGNWLELPQPALGGRRAADLIDTPTGLDVVRRLLGAIASGSFQ